ncbi:MAG: HepT-like ribonuclease domain-containing protein, partial [Chloroflexota bacterium]
EDVRGANPEIPWREITGMRNKLMHEYFGVNTRVVWRTLKEDLLVIIPHLRKMLAG